MERLGRISEKANLICNIVALELHTMKKALLSSERNIGFGYSTEQKWDTGTFKTEIAWKPNYKLSWKLFNCRF